MMKRIIYISIFLFLGIMINSCNKEESYSWELEMQKLDEYIEHNNITVEPTSGGIYYIETLEGDGVMPKAGDIVTVEYTGTFLDGEEFESGKNTFKLGIRDAIKGWDIGIAKMKKGGKAILIIPSTSAYGISGRGKIPPYTTLVFEVELLEVN
ncbi:FKBP-type peptidyl-prolyl cis-trans isomerase [Bacteroidota bacterium]